MKGFFLTVSCLILLICSFAFAAEVEIGEAKARLISNTDARTHVNFFVSPAPKVTITNINLSTPLLFKVTYQVQDDSKMSGANQKAYAAFKAYDLINYKWIEPGQQVWQEGKDTTGGTYNHNGRWVLAQIPTGNVMRFYGRLYAKTRGHDQTKEQIFYIANTPVNTALNQIQREAAPKWIASRYENAINMSHLTQSLKKLANPKLSVDFNAEMLNLLVSTAGLVAPVTPADYAQSAGMEILGLVTNLYTSAYVAGMVSGASEIVEAYQYLKWTQQTLQNSFNKFFDVYNSWLIELGLSGSDELINAMESAAKAMVEEGKALENYIYSPNNPYRLSEWKAKLKAERDALFSVAEKSQKLENKATQFFLFPEKIQDDYTRQKILQSINKNTLRNLGEQKVYPFLKTVNKFALKDYLILDKIVKTGGL